MSLSKVTNLAKWLQGSQPLPAGAIPLALDSSGGLICVMPNSRWIRWLASVIHSQPPETQRAVLDVVIGELGGTAAATAERLGVSTRTVEGWRVGRTILPEKALEMAEAMAAVA